MTLRVSAILTDMGVQEGDWMECRSSHTLSEMIRFRCGSVTNHGQPIHFVNGVAHVLDMEWPRMRVTPLVGVEVPDAQKGDFDFFICRQKRIPDSKYQPGCRRFLEPLARARPYYDAISFTKLLFMLPFAFASFRRCKSKAVSGLEVSLVERLNFARWMSRIEKQLWYCTELLQGIWKTGVGEDVIMKVYGTTYCSPREAERFCVDHYEFISGVCGGVESDALWREARARWTRK